MTCDVQYVKEGRPTYRSTSALASAAGISCLEICSRTDKSRNTWSVIVKVCAYSWVVLFMGFSTLYREISNYIWVRQFVGPEYHTEQRSACAMPSIMWVSLLSPPFARPLIEGDHSFRSVAAHISVRHELGKSFVRK